MKKQVRIKPKAGLIIPDVDRRDALPETGRLVVWSVYWQRRLRDGDIEIIEEKKEK